MQSGHSNGSQGLDKISVLEWADKKGGILPEIAHVLKELRRNSQCSCSSSSLSDGSEENEDDEEARENSTSQGCRMSRINTGLKNGLKKRLAWSQDHKLSRKELSGLRQSKSGLSDVQKPDGTDTKGKEIKTGSANVQRSSVGFQEERSRENSSILKPDSPISDVAMIVPHLDGKNEFLHEAPDQVQSTKADQDYDIIIPSDAGSHPRTPFPTLAMFIDVSKQEAKKTQELPEPEKEVWHDTTDIAIKRFSTEELNKMTNDFSQEIGSGGFATVYKGSFQGVDVAVKRLNPIKANRTFKREVQMLRDFSHPHVLSLIGIDTVSFSIVSEYMAGGSLQEWLRDGKPNILTWEDRVRICREMTDGLMALHSQNVVHRDLKPGNVLLDECKISKISDMGLAKQSKGDLATMSDIRGTPGYIDPFLLTGNSSRPKFSKLSDIFSLGLIMLQLITKMERVDFVHNILFQLDKKVESRYQNKSNTKSSDKPSPDRMLREKKTRWKDCPGGFEALIANFCRDYLDPKSRAVPKEYLHHAVSLIFCCVEKSPSLRPNLGLLLDALEKLQKASKIEIREQLQSPFEQADRMAAMERVHWRWRRTTRG